MSRNDMQVAAYELEQKSESVLPFVVDALLEKDTNDQVYSVMVKNMTQTELELALDAETRPEYLRAYTWNGTKRNQGSRGGVVS